MTEYSTFNREYPASSTVSNCFVVALPIDLNRMVADLTVSLRCNFDSSEFSLIIPVTMRPCRIVTILIALM